MRAAKSLLLCCAFIFSSCHWDQPIDVYDRFESQELSPIWGTWRFLPGAVEMQSDLVRSGTYATRITLHPGDQMDDEKGTILERAELVELAELTSVEDLNYSYSFSLFLPEDFPIVPTRLVIAQWKQYSFSENYSPDNPVIALRFKSGKLRVTCQVGMQKEVLYRQTEETRNKWLQGSWKSLLKT